MYLMPLIQPHHSKISSNPSPPTNTHHSEFKLKLTANQASLLTTGKQAGILGLNAR